MLPADEFRRVLAHFATGVTVVTACDREARPTGLTVSAFASVSLTPPLVLVCVDHASQTHPALQASPCFAVNILAAHQADLSRRFASTRPDKFDGVAYHLSDRGLPLLDEVLAHLECRTVQAVEAGDHTIFVGRVEGAGLGAGHPLLYYRGQYDHLCGGRS